MNVYTVRSSSSTSTSRGGTARVGGASLRERQLRDLLGMLGDTMVQKAVFVTATQATNLWLCDAMGVAPVMITASEEKLRARGYASRRQSAASKS